MFLVVEHILIIKWYLCVPVGLAVWLGISLDVSVNFSHQ